LQTLAEPGSAIMSETTHRLVQGMAESRFAGEHWIKGKAKPQRVFRLEAIRQSVARFESALSRGLTPYVGRSCELETLKQSLAEAGSDASGFMRPCETPFSTATPRCAGAPTGCLRPNIFSMTHIAVLPQNRLMECAE